MNRLMMLVLCGTFAAGAESETGAWVNNEGCFCGVLPSPVNAFVIKGDGSNAERGATFEALQRWNQYAEIFSATFGSGRAASGNGINEIDLLIDNASAETNYGYIFTPNTYGVTIISAAASFGNFNECRTFDITGCANFSETDILVNGEFVDGWSVDHKNYDDALIQATVLHEAGHAWGAHHVFSLPDKPNSFSTLNYMQDDAARFVTRMDANTLRAAYPTQVKSMVDVGVFPLVYGNKQYGETWASVEPTVVAVDELFKIKNFTVQNIGNQDASATSVKFYLSSDTTIDSNDVYLGEKLYASFPVNSEDATSVTLLFPNVPPGEYYVGGIVTVNGIADAVTENNTFIVGRPSRIRVKVGINLVNDPGYELGANNVFWTEYSLRYGTPICSENDCGTNLFGIGPWSGSNWLWFGDSWNEEEGFVQQIVNIPAGGPASLEFFLAIPESDTTGYFRVLLDNNELFRVTHADLARYNWYKKISLDISDYADGANHTLKIDSRTEAGGSDGLSFFVDEVAILSYPGGERCYTSDVTLSNTHYERGVTRYYSQSGFDTERYVELSLGAGVEMFAPKMVLREGFVVPNGATFRAVSQAVDCSAL